MKSRPPVYKLAAALASDCENRDASASQRDELADQAGRQVRPAAVRPGFGRIGLIGALFNLARIIDIPIPRTADSGACLLGCLWSLQLDIASQSPSRALVIAT